MVLAVLMYLLPAQLIKELQPHAPLSKDLMEHNLAVMHQQQHLQQIALLDPVLMQTQQEQSAQLQIVLVGYQAVITMEKIIAQLEIAIHIMELKQHAVLLLQQ